MKKKADFITNSSSASFIMTFKTDCMDSDEFIEKFNEFVEQSGDRDLTDIYTTEVRCGNNVGEFIIERWTSMYNDHDDIPSFMKRLIIMAEVDDKRLADGLIYKSFEIFGD